MSDRTVSDTQAVVGLLSDVLDTATLIVDGQILRLAGIRTGNSPTVVDAMRSNLPDLEQVCAEAQIAGQGRLACWSRSRIICGPLIRCGDPPDRDRR